MAKKVNLSQSGPEWHKWRAGGLGGSDAPALLGESRFCSPDELLEVKTGLRTVAENDRMARGKRLEPEARARYMAETGNEVEPCCAEHEEHPWLRASLDGWSEDGKLVLEIKCPSVYAHKAALRGKVPDYYKGQLQHQLLVTGAERVDYFSYCPDEPGTFKALDEWAVIEVYPDQEYMARLLVESRKFWERFQKLQNGKPRVSKKRAAE